VTRVRVHREPRVGQAGDEPVLLRPVEQRVVLAQITRVGAVTWASSAVSA
jgi:hypothetical protein